MYAEFSFDLVPGPTPNDQVLADMLQRFAAKPSGDPRRRCDLLSDTFICEIVNTRDYESLHGRLSRLRNDLDQQFNYTFSLRSKGAPIRIRGGFDRPLAEQIVNG